MPIQGFYFVDKAGKCAHKGKELHEKLQSKQPNAKLYNLSDENLQETLDYLASVNQAILKRKEQAQKEDVSQAQEETKTPKIDKPKEYPNKTIEYFPDGTPFERFTLDETDYMSDEQYASLFKPFDPKQPLDLQENTDASLDEYFKPIKKMFEERDAKRSNNVIQFKTPEEIEEEEFASQFVPFNYR